MKHRIRPVLAASAAVLVALSGISTADAKSKSSSKHRVPGSSAASSNNIRLTATAGNKATGRMKSTYREYNQGTTIRQVFKGKVKGFAPGAELAVTVNGNQITTLIVGPSGTGEFEFSSVGDNHHDDNRHDDNHRGDNHHDDNHHDDNHSHDSHGDNYDDELSLPGGFPRLRSGDTIVIGNLSASYR